MPTEQPEVQDSETEAFFERNNQALEAQKERLENEGSRFPVFEKLQGKIRKAFLAGTLSLSAFLAVGCEGKGGSVSPATGMEKTTVESTVENKPAPPLQKINEQKPAENHREKRKEVTRTWKDSDIEIRSIEGQTPVKYKVDEKGRELYPVEVGADGNLVHLSSERVKLRAEIATHDDSHIEEVEGREGTAPVLYRVNKDGERLYPVGMDTDGALVHLSSKFLATFHPEVKTEDPQTHTEVIEREGGARTYLEVDNKTGEVKREISGRR